MDILDKEDQSQIKFTCANETTGKEVTVANIVKRYKIDD